MMRARTRSIGIFLTIVFIALVGYAGVTLYQLPERIVADISIEPNTKLENVRAALKNNDLKKVEEILNKKDSRNTEKIRIAKEATYPAFRSFGLMLLAGLALMFLLLAASYKTSAETIVYIDKKEDDSFDEGSDDGGVKGLLEGFDDKINLHAQKEGDWSADDFEGLVRLVCTALNAGAGMLYSSKGEEKNRMIHYIAGYAVVLPDSGELTFEYGEGIAGQVAKTQKAMRVSDLPDGYMKIFSGLGESFPPYLTVLPILKDGKTKGVFEVSTFQAINDYDFQQLQNFCKQLSEKL